MAEAMSSPAAANSPQQAALLLLMLGEEKAAEVMKHMAPAEVERVGMAMAEISDVGSHQAHWVAQSFRTELDQQTPLGVGVPGYMRRVLSNSMGEQRGSSLADKLLGDEASADIDALRWLSRDALVRMLIDEHPQIIAVALALLEPDQAAAVLKALPENTRLQVVQRLARLEKIPQSALDQVQQILQDKAALSQTLKSAKVDGTSVAAGILNLLDSDMEQGLLASIAETDPALSEKVSEQMFVFSSLLELDKRGMQTLLSQVSNDQLAVALKGADAELRDKIFTNMSKRAGDMLKDDMEAKGPVKVSDVEEAQKAIMEVARGLADEGRIQLGRSDDVLE